MEKDQTVARARREKVAAILRAVEKNKKYKYITEGSLSKEFKMVHFDGRIGLDVTFTKEYHEYCFGTNATIIDLMYKGEELGRIVIQQEISRHTPRSNSMWNINANANAPWYQTIFDATEISVLSPSWEVDQGTITKTKQTAMKINKIYRDAGYDAKKQVTTLSVCHTDQETADEVLNRMSNAIAKSQDKAVIAKKLRKLNLPSKVTIKDKDVLADNIVNQIHNADREM